jgi:putative oxidoreductase
MNSKVSMVIRILLALMLLVFGINKFFNFLPAPEGMSADAIAYFTALTSVKLVSLIGVVEILTGLALLFNKWGALMALILMSISVNAVLYQATLDMGNIGPSIGLLVLNLLVLYGYKDKYKELLS